MRQQHMEFEEIRRQMEEDIDTEIQNAMTRYEKKLRASREEGLRLKGENGIMRKKFNSLYKEIDDMKAEKVRLLGEHKKLQDSIRNYEKEATGLKKEIQERDEFIQDKEKRVYELKKSNQELEKFKFVLDYKIRDLKKQIEPKEKDITEMSIHIQGLSKELEDYYSRNLELEAGIVDFKTKLGQCKKRYIVEKQKHKNVNKFINAFKSDLENVMEHFQASPQQLQKQFKKMYKKFCKTDNDDDQGLEAVEGDVREEVQRQRGQLLNLGYNLRREVNQNMMGYKKDESERIKENERIIKSVSSIHCRAFIVFDRELVGIRKETKLQIKSNEIEKFEQSLSGVSFFSGCNSLSIYS
jgi:chromosome segregation ATPase